MTSMRSHYILGDLGGREAAEAQGELRRMEQGQRQPGGGEPYTAWRPPVGGWEQATLLGRQPGCHLGGTPKELFR